MPGIVHGSLRQVIRGTSFAAASGTMLLATALFMSAVPASAITQRDVLIKSSASPAVYYLASDGKRYVFSTFGAYRSWYSSFDGIITVTPTELASYPLGGNVTYRPGVRLVKIRTDVKVYAVEKGGTLRWVQTETEAKRLYGSDWNKKIDDVPDAFFVNYRIGDPIESESEYDPVGASSTARTPGEDKSLQVTIGAHFSDTEPRTGNAASLRGETAGEDGCLGDAWRCGDWGACGTDGNQTRTCSKSFDCSGVDTPPPSSTRACVSGEACGDGVWSCGDWGACSQSGTKTRSCTKLKPDCSAATPATTDSCQPPSTQPPPQSCTADTWSCSNWGACSSAGRQQRSCAVTNDCPGVDTPRPDQSRDCTPPNATVTVARSSAVVTTDADPGTTLPVLAFTLRAADIGAVIHELNFSALVDANGDGTFAHGSEDGVTSQSLLSSCQLLAAGAQGYTTLSANMVQDSDGVHFLAATGTGGIFTLSLNVTATVQVRCTIPVQAPAAHVALSLNNDFGTYPVYATADVANPVGNAVVQGFPVNGGSSIPPAVAVNVRASGPRGPTYNYVSLPTSVLSDGTMTVMRFTAYAHDHAYALGSLHLQLTPSTTHGFSVAPTAGASLRDVTGSGSNFQGTTTMDSGGSADCNGILSPCAVNITLGESVVIPQDGFRTFDVHLAVSGTSIGDALTTGPESGPGSTIWNVAVPAAGGGYTLGDGGASGLPADGQTLSR